MRAFVAFALFAAVAMAAVEGNIRFIADENLTNAEADFKFRWQSADVIPLVGAAALQFPDKIFSWSSASIDVHATKEEALAKANMMISAALPPSTVVHPFLLLGYGEGTAAAKFDPTAFVTSIQGNSVFSGGLVAMAALSIDELDTKGNVVKTVDLRSNTCTPKKIQEGEVTGMTCSLSFSQTPATVTVTYLTSKQAGILEYGDTPVSPRSIEMVLEVENFKLENKDNHARLNIPMFTAKAAGKIDGNAEIITKDSEEVYVAVSGYAVVKGEREEVDVEVKAESGNLLSKDMALHAFLNGVFTGGYNFHMAHVDFPAGVESFVYDPAAGSGSNVYKAGASTMALSLLVALVCTLLYLF